MILGKISDTLHSFVIMNIIFSPVRLVFPWFDISKNNSFGWCFIQWIQPLVMLLIGCPETSFSQPESKYFSLGTHQYRVLIPNIYQVWSETLHSDFKNTFLKWK